MFTFSACFVRLRAKSGCYECLRSVNGIRWWDCGAAEFFSLWKLFLCLLFSAFCCYCCERWMCKVLSWKLADSNLEKLYLAGFLRHGFLIKRTFTFLLPSCLGFDFFFASVVEWILVTLQHFYFPASSTGLYAERSD